MTKPELLELIRKKHAEMEQLLGSLSEEQMTTAGVNGEWSIKDILAHIGAWERRTIDRLNAARLHETPKGDPVKTDEEMNALNERFYQEHRHLPLLQVLADFEALHQQMLEEVQAAADEDLFTAQHIPWLGDTLLWEIVAGNTYEHYEEHEGPIREWLEQKNQAIH